jgi:hypothetical protein
LVSIDVYMTPREKNGVLAKDLQNHKHPSIANMLVNEKRNSHPIWS